ncbi:segregation/condensation protein A [Candidatus Micrarchaeota archaeon]|nr:segregation/condensation protein A [Candidatus Micrarchaeota archaeon]
MDLLNLVVQPTWREFLLDLIEKEEMDPWDIDLVQVSDAYLKKVRDLQSLDLRIPANVILASALLLRLKSDALSFEEPVEEEFFEERILINEDLPQLVLKPNRPRSRRVTLDELIQAVESVMREGRRVKVIRSEQVGSINIELPQKSMSELMQEAFDYSLKLKDADGVLTFSDLYNKMGYSLVAALLPVLHLMQDQKIVLWQAEVFNEIFIKVLPEAN